MNNQRFTPRVDMSSLTLNADALHAPMPYPGVPNSPFDIGNLPLSTGPRTPAANEPAIDRKVHASGIVPTLQFVAVLKKKKLISLN